MKKYPVWAYMTLAVFITMLTACKSEKTNTPPTAYPQKVTTNEDSAVIITLKAYDPDDVDDTEFSSNEDDLIFTVTSQPEHGTLSGKAPDLLYTPKPNFFGNDSFRFKASDGKAASNEATVNITVKSVNDIPTADPKSATIDQNTYASITLSGSDIDDANLSFIITHDPEHGTLSGTPPHLTYTPHRDFYGFDTFKYISTDGEDNSTEVIVNITVKERPFRIKIDTNITGATNAHQFAIPVNLANSEYDYRVDCNNDGRDEGKNIDGVYICDYNHPGQYTIAIYGSFPQIDFNNSSDKNKLLAVEEWGTHIWSSFERAFMGCANMNITATDKPNLSEVRDTSYMFFGASSFNAPIGDWNTSNIRNMQAMFEEATSFDQDISGWDTANVTDMSRMFFNASGFSGHDLSSWDVGSVHDHTEFCTGWGSGNIPPDAWSCP